MHKDICKRFAEVRWDEDVPFYQSLQRCRLAVIDNPETPAIEALSANVPTILFWDPARWEMRDEAQPYFCGLRKVGILWDFPEQAAAKVQAVYDDPSWWWSNEVQEARQAFAKTFALVAHDWTDRWVRSLAAETGYGELYQDASH